MERDEQTPAAGRAPAPGTPPRGMIEELWERSIVPVLFDYIRIPALSPAFDPEWSAHGHLAQAVALLRDWAEARGIDGAIVEVVELEGRTPVILVEVPPSGGEPSATESGPPGDTVLLYGHLD